MVPKTLPGTERKDKKKREKAGQKKNTTKYTLIKKHVSPRIPKRPKYTVLSKIGTSQDKLRHSLVDETPEIAVKETMKNYQSNGALDSYEKTTSVARSSRARANQSSVSSSKDQKLDSHFDWNRQTMLNRFKMKVLQGKHCKFSKFK